MGKGKKAVRRYNHCRMLPKLTGGTGKGGGTEASGCQVEQFLRFTDPELATTLRLSEAPMSSKALQQLSQAYYDRLLVGDRLACRNMIQNALQAFSTPRELLVDLVWSTMEHLLQLYREDRISITNLYLATRLNRTVTDQITALLEPKPANGKTVLIVCGDDEPEELGGQICSDLFEAEGYNVRFAGGGVPNDRSEEHTSELQS